MLCKFKMLAFHGKFKLLMKKRIKIEINDLKLMRNNE